MDDLVIDTKYTDQIPFLDRMQPEERQAYDQNVRNMGELRFPLRCGGYDDRRRWQKN